MIHSKLVAGHQIKIEGAIILIRGNLLCGTGWPTTLAGSFFVPRHENENIYAALAVTGLNGNELSEPRNVIVFVDFESANLSIKSNDIIGSWLAKAKLCDVNVISEQGNDIGLAA